MDDTGLQNTYEDSTTNTGNISHRRHNIARDSGTAKFYYEVTVFFKNCEATVKYYKIPMTQKMTQQEAFELLMEAYQSYMVEDNDWSGFIHYYEEWWKPLYGGPAGLT